MRRSKAILFAMVIAASSPALGADPPTRPTFAQLDANSDGKVSQDEFEKKMRALAKERAANGGAQGRRLRGRAGGGDRLLARWFGRLDANQDGALDAKEWEAGAQRPEPAAPASFAT